MDYNIPKRITDLEKRIKELEEVMKSIEENINRINSSNTIVKPIEKKEDKEKESI